MNKTFITKESDIKKKYFLIDAQGKILGRLATKIATILIGKKKPMYATNVDTGDYVVVINAEKIIVTGKKLKEKVYKRYSGYPGGLKTEDLTTMLKKNPAYVLEHAVKGMIPKGPLGRDMFSKLRVYAGPNHPHKAQNPQPIEV